MVENDYGRFKVCITGLIEVCGNYGRELSSGAIMLWWQALERYSIEAIEDAASKYLQSPDVTNSSPKPADLIRFVEGGGSRDNAEMAWTQVLKACADHGAYRSVKFDDPCINQSVKDVGGWAKLCATDQDELPFVGNRFRQIYEVYRRRGSDALTQTDLYLPGLAEVSNASSGHRVAPPVLISTITARRLEKSLPNHGSQHIRLVS